MSISPHQCRAARSMLGWSQEELSEAANVARTTIADFERGLRLPVANNLKAIQTALENMGIEFIGPTNLSQGVILHQK